MLYILLNLLSLQVSLYYVGNSNGEDSIATLADILEIPKFYKNANCVGENQDLFFPERGGSTVKAKAICKECKVREECLEFAVERKERFGIWGGKSERERRAIPRERRQKEKKES